MGVALLGITTACDDSSDQESQDPAASDTARADSDATDSSSDDVASDSDEPSPLVDVRAEMSDVWEPPAAFCVGDLCSAGPDHAPDPAERGPFPVGVRTELIELVDVDGHDRVIKTEIWYPGVPGTGESDPFAYDLVADGPAELRELLEDSSVEPMEVNAHLGMEIHRDFGPFPVVYFSHGAYGIRFQSVFFTIELASHGFIVVAPDHTDETLYDVILNGYESAILAHSAIQRNGDGDFLIDYFQERNEDPDDFFYGTVDGDNMGFTGHSFGAMMSLYEGGANPRIRVVVPFAPATTMLPLGGVHARTYPVPFMMHGGLMDNTLDYDGEMLPFYEHAPPPKYLVELQRAGHYTYTDICRLDLSTVAGEIGFDDGVDALDDGCHADNIPYEDAQVIINQFSIGFLNFYLRHSPESAQFFLSAAADEYAEELRFESVVAEE